MEPLTAIGITALVLAAGVAIGYHKGFHDGELSSIFEENERLKDAVEDGMCYRCKERNRYGEED